MAIRGRPRYPDILTPREWEVLALLREGLGNDGIAARLSITERTATYHVSEILSKLGVASREEAAAWQPEERRPWGLAAGAPFAFVRRKVSFGWLSPATAAVLGVLMVAGIGLLAWGLVRTGGGEGADAPGVSVRIGTVEPEVAIVREPGVYLMRSDGSDLRRLPGVGRLRDSFAWAPSGDRFVVASGCQEEHQLLLGSAADDALDKLASLPAEASSIFWSPAGDMLGLSLSEGAGLAAGPAGAVLVVADTGEVTVIDGAGLFYGWSHDGRKYAVSIDRVATVIDTVTGEQTENLVDSMASLLWSPTLDRLAFTYIDDPASDTLGLDVVNADGTGRQMLVSRERHIQTGGSPLSIAWSPDGRRLLVKSRAEPFGFRFLVYDVEEPEQLLDLGDTFKLSSGEWSPDGEHLALERNGHVALERDGSPGPEVFIEVVSTATDERREISLNDLTRSPKFSPDGHQIAFSASQPNDRDALDLYLVDVDGGAPRMLADGVGFNVFAHSWSADGSYITFTAGPITGDGCHS